jgi:hypothetical protein
MQTVLGSDETGTKLLAMNVSNEVPMSKVKVVKLVALLPLRVNELAHAIIIVKCCILRVCRLLNGVLSTELQLSVGS